MSRQLQLLGETTENDDWDFAKSDTQSHVHGLHPYPARMIPQIASKLLNIYFAQNNRNTPQVLDPFSGSGTVLVEAVCRGCPATGIDINPFAVLLSKCKTNTETSFEKFRRAKRRIVRHLDANESLKKVNFVPDYTNIEHWFKSAVIEKLSHIHYYIHQQSDSDVQIPLQVAFAKTVMSSSNVNWKSSRYIRVFPKEQLTAHRPRVFETFRAALSEIQMRLSQFLSLKRANARVIRADARTLPLPDRFADLIITSPPYGEERNTIPYIRWSKLFLLWMGLPTEDIRSAEKTELGGSNRIQVKKCLVPSPTFWKAVTGVPEKRANEAARFLIDYKTTLHEMRRTLKDSGTCCIVIGNRSIKRRPLDMGKVTIELAATEKLFVSAQFGRRIPSKLIPWTGPTGDTISHESIIILKKG